MHLIVHLIFQIKFFFFFNDTATTEIYTLSLHDALPISGIEARDSAFVIKTKTGLELKTDGVVAGIGIGPDVALAQRSEEHTSELQSRLHLVCRLLLEKKKKTVLLVKMIINDRYIVRVSH